MATFSLGFIDGATPEPCSTHQRRVSVSTARAGPASETPHDSGHSLGGRQQPAKPDQSCRFQLLKREQDRDHAAALT